METNESLRFDLILPQLAVISICEGRLYEQWIIPTLADRILCGLLDFKY